MRLLNVLTLLHRLIGRRPPADRLGFGYSRDLEPPTPAAVPDGVDLYYFTGRTRQEAIR